jgi:hypothetical protein
MSTLETRFREGLLADAAVLAALGPRLYHQTVRQLPPYPSAAYQRIMTRRIGTIEQVDNWMSSGWARFQVTILDTDDVRLVETMDKIRKALQTFDLSSEDFTGSPAVRVVRQAPNLVVRETVDVQPETKPPVFVGLLDANCFFRDVN